MSAASPIERIILDDPQNPVSYQRRNLPHRPYFSLSYCFLYICTWLNVSTLLIQAFPSGIAGRQGGLRRREANNHYSDFDRGVGARLWWDGAGTIYGAWRPDRCWRAVVHTSRKRGESVPQAYRSGE